MENAAHTPPAFPTSPAALPLLFNANSPTDSAGEAMFLGGTAIRIGTAILQPGSPGFVSADDKQIRFVAPIIDLATKKIAVVSRDGTETTVAIPNIDTRQPLSITRTSVTPVNEANSLLQVDVTPSDPTPGLPLVLIIGGKAFGYTDAPLQYSGSTLSVVLPTAFLAANRDVIIKPLLVDSGYVARAQLLPVDVEVERLSIVEQTEKTVRYILYGRRLTGMIVRVPANTDLTPIGTGVDQDRVRFLQIDLPVVKTLKQLVLQRPGERPFAVAIPPLVEPPKQAPKFGERVTVGTDEATIVGDGLQDVGKVVALNQDLTKLELSKDGKSLKVKGLAALGITSVAKTIDCDLITKAGKTATTIQLEVVNSKVESVQK